MRCPACGEYEGMWVHHGHEDGDDEACEQNQMCHTYCTNCDYGVCELC